MENRVEVERGRWPDTLLLILEHSEEVSFSSSLFKHTEVRARPAHEGAVAIKQAQRGAQIERETGGGRLAAGTVPLQDRDEE